MRRLLPGILVVLFLCGCESVELVGQRFRAERAFWGAQRKLNEMGARPEGVKSAQVDVVRKEFLAVAQSAGGARVTDPYLRSLYGRCLLQNYDLLMAEGKKLEGATALAGILDAYVADSVIRGEALWRRAKRRGESGDSAAALVDYREIVGLVRPHLASGETVSGQVIALPFTLLQYRLARGGVAAASADAAVAEKYYQGIAAATPLSLEGFAARAYLGDLYQAIGQPRVALAELDSLQRDCARVPSEIQRRPELLLRLAAVASDGAGDVPLAHHYLDLMAREHAKSPLRGRSQLMRARLFVRSKRNAEAEKSLHGTAEDASLSEAIRATAWVEIARLMELQNNREEARRCYREAYTNFPLTQEGMRAPLFLVDGYTRVNDVDGAHRAGLEAQKFYTGLVAKYAEAPTAPQIRWLLVQTNLILKDWPASAQALGDVVKHAGGAAEELRALRMLAQVHEEKLHDPKQAAQDYRKILARFPDAPFRADVEARIKRLGG